ncbi:hypothetical protein F4860DRAFT_264658 [Xylaria cubensis]|nr:hypothetical protein F4860DRAFT_264658 [Xylaria cubensis]
MMGPPKDPFNPSDRDQANASPRVPESSTDMRKKKRNEVYMNFVSLMRFDFTRDSILIIEEGLDKFEFVPLRNMIDTASDENFINRKVLQDYKITRWTWVNSSKFLMIGSDVLDS